MWVGTMGKCVRNRLFTSTLRRIAIRTTRPQRITSTQALPMLARIPPIELTVEQKIQSKKDANSTQEMQNKMLEKMEREIVNRKRKSSMDKKTRVLSSLPALFYGEPIRTLSFLFSVFLLSEEESNGRQPGCTDGQELS